MIRSCFFKCGDLVCNHNSSLEPRCYYFCNWIYAYTISHHNYKSFRAQLVRQQPLAKGRSVLTYPCLSFADGWFTSAICYKSLGVYNYMSGTTFCVGG